MKNYKSVVPKINVQDAIKQIIDSSKEEYIVSKKRDNLFLTQTPQAFNLNEIYNKLIRKKISLKQALLDQSLIVGIGNIYANEALFHSKLNPQRLTYTLKKAEISQLLSSCKFVLKLSLKNGGSSINDYKSPDGTLGSFQSLFKVYQKKHVIYKKKTFKIKKIIQNGRSTFFSPALQK